MLFDLRHSRQAQLPRIDRQGRQWLRPGTNVRLLSCDNDEQDATLSTTRTCTSRRAPFSQHPSYRGLNTTNEIRNSTTPNLSTSASIVSERKEIQSIFCTGSILHLTGLSRQYRQTPNHTSHQYVLALSLDAINTWSIQLDQFDSRPSSTRQAETPPTTTYFTNQ